MQTGERLAPIDEAPFDIVRVDEDLTAPALSSAELLQSLLLIESQVRELDLRAAEADTVRGQLIMSRLQTLLEGAIDSLLALQSHEDREASLDPFAAEGSDWFSQYTPILAPPKIADICFAGTFELKRALNALSEAQTVEQLLPAAEAARRKLRRALRAVLGAQQAMGGEPATLDFDRTLLADLESALAVRRLYARLREGLKRPSDDDADSLLNALRYAAGALALLVASPEYDQVRAADRALLRRLRERALDWAKNGRRREPGLQLLEDIWTCAGLLRGINQRQELRAHDIALISELCADEGCDPSDWLRRLEPLSGLDERIDALIEQGRDALSSELVQEGRRLLVTMI